jgi:hypothetical protein
MIISAISNVNMIQLVYSVYYIVDLKRINQMIKIGLEYQCVKDVDDDGLKNTI